jgi:hypothetical protein
MCVTLACQAKRLMASPDAPGSRILATAGGNNEGRTLVGGARFGWLQDGW